MIKMVNRRKSLKLYLLGSLKYLFPLIFLGVIYLIGAFVAFSWNPMDWWIFYSGLGRVIAIIIFGLYLRALGSFYLDI